MRLHLLGRANSCGESYVGQEEPVDRRKVGLLLSSRFSQI